MTQSQNTSFTNEEFDILTVNLQRKVCLLEITARLAKIPCVPNEFDVVLNATKQNILDVIERLDSNLPKNQSDQVERVYWQIQGDLETLKTLNKDLYERYNNDELIDIIFHLHVISDPYILVSSDKKRENLIKNNMRSVTIINLTKDEYDRLRSAPQERVYLKVVSREQKVSDLQFLRNDLDLLYHDKIEMSIMSSTELTKEPYMVLSFDKTHEIVITRSIYVHTNKVAYWKIHQSGYNFCLKTINDKIADDDRCYLKIFAENSPLSDQKCKIQAFLEHFYNVIPDGEPMKKLTEVFFNLKDHTIPLILLSTDKMFLDGIRNSISQHGLFNCKLSLSDYIVNKNQLTPA